MNSSKTLKIATRRLSFTKIDKSGSAKKKSLTGWEYEPPKKGKNYDIFLANGKVLRTSPVEDVTENFHSLIVRTANSVYQVKYLKADDETLASL
jgi:hypothetical protein